MATIKFRRGSGQPTGLTAYEPAWDTTNNRFFVNNGATALWVGAKIENDSALGGAGSSAFVVPTQLAVKTYVDNQVAGGAVTSVNGTTGAVSIFSGNSGILVAGNLEKVLQYQILVFCHSTEILVLFKEYLQQLRELVFQYLVQQVLLLLQTQVY
jgi:hypothetical protein